MFDWYKRKLPLKSVARKLGIPIVVAAIMFSGSACSRTPPDSVSVTPEQLYENIYHHARHSDKTEAQAALLAAEGMRVITGENQLPEEREVTRKFLNEMKNDANRISDDLRKHNQNPDDGSNVIGTEDAGYEW